MGISSNAFVRKLCERVRVRVCLRGGGGGADDDDEAQWADKSIEVKSDIHTCWMCTHSTFGVWIMQHLNFTSAHRTLSELILGKKEKKVSRVLTCIAKVAHTCKCVAFSGMVFSFLGGIQSTFDYSSDWIGSNVWYGLDERMYLEYDINWCYDSTATELIDTRRHTLHTICTLTKWEK